MNTDKLQEERALKAIGVSRMSDNEKAILVSLNRKPSEDEMRAIQISQRDAPDRPLPPIGSGENITDMDSAVVAAMLAARKINCPILASDCEAIIKAAHAPLLAEVYKIKLDARQAIQVCSDAMNGHAEIIKTLEEEINRLKQGSEPFAYLHEKHVEKMQAGLNHLHAVLHKSPKHMLRAESEFLAVYTTPQPDQSQRIADALKLLDNVTASTDTEADYLGCAENLLRAALSKKEGE